MMRSVGMALMVAALGIGVYWAVARPHSTASLGGVTTTPQNSARVVPEGMKEYRSTTYRFSLLYPERYTVREVDEGGDARTIVFENTETAEGFQLFVVPYDNLIITEERFAMDMPSGVRTNPTAIRAGGVEAVTFGGEQEGVGPTREAWFIKDGLLYELTTLEPLEAQLAEVVESWEFISQKNSLLY